MMPLLRFLPFLALIALMSIEVSVEAQGQIMGDQYSQLISNDAVNGLQMSITALNNPGTADQVSTQTCTKPQVMSGACSPEPAITWDKQGTVNVDFTLPPASSSGAFLNGGTPSQYRVWICYSEPDLTKRKWRAFKNIIKKDKSCLQKGDFKQYPAAGGAITESIPIKSTTPKGEYTVQIMVQCQGQEGERFCHVENPKEDRIVERPVYFGAYVMESRPTELFVATLICVFIGPAMLFAFIIYERGVLAKKAT